jgi:diguanylate cyclase (GGDEF)-like protein
VAGRSGVNELKRPGNLYTALHLTEKAASFVMIVLLAALMATGVIGGKSAGMAGLIIVAIFILYAAARLAFLGYAYVHNREDTSNPLRSLEAGLLIVTFASVIIRITGGLDSWLAPSMYLSIATIAATFRKPTALASLLLALIFETGLPLLAGEADGRLTHLIGNALFIAVFALFNSILTGFGSGIERHKARSQIKQILGDIEADAKRFRIEEAGRPERDSQDHDQKHELSTYFEMKEVLQDTLRQLALGLNAFTATVLWYDPQKRTLKVVEADSASSVITGREFSADQGILHGVVSSGSTLKMTVSESSRKAIGYYRDSEPINALCAAPIGSGDSLAGVLVVDRSEARPFTDTEVEIIQLSARQIWRATVNESVLRNLDKSQHEYFHLAEASKALSKVFTETDVLRVSLQETAKIAPYDLGAVVMRDPKEGTCEIVACWPKEVNLDGVTFSGNSNLVDWVIRRNQSLAYHHFSDLPRRPTIFTREERLAHVESLLVVPLNVKAQTVGAFVLANGEKDFFTEDLQHIFQIIANQIAVSLENAQIYTQLEEMATTDGLTGLMNKRTITGRIEETISRAERYDHPVSLMILDIDHFKRVNDTYGHPVGDRVLREVGRVFKESMRRIDLVGRWGGEEFMVLLDSSGADDALDKAEQLRERIGSLVFDSEGGEFSVTMSAGIAVFPDDSRQIEELIEKADVALYQSKRAGRNRATLYKEL